MAEEQSEFGSGLVVCLAKFSEHLGRDSEPVSLRLLKERDARHFEWSVDYEMKGGASREEAERKAYSEACVMWANGASDHFYDLDVEKAPEPLKELADLTLAMGHGFSGRIWTSEDMEKVRELWRQSCLALDEMLGCDGDWGQW